MWCVNPAVKCLRLLVLCGYGTFHRRIIYYRRICATRSRILCASVSAPEITSEVALDRVVWWWGRWLLCWSKSVEGESGVGRVQDDGGPGESGADLAM